MESDDSAATVVVIRVHHGDSAATAREGGRGNSAVMDRGPVMVLPWPWGWCQCHYGYN